MQIEWMLGSLGATAVLVIGAVVWMHVQTQRAVERIDDRVAHLVAAVSLLTDTTEAALRDFATEIARQGSVLDGARPRTRAVTQRRVATAARRGHTVQDIAAAEEVSEGEVRLRLQLERAAKERANHASMR